MNKKIFFRILLFFILIISLLVIKTAKNNTKQVSGASTATVNTQNEKAIAKPIVDEKKVNLENFYAPVLAYHHIALRQPQNSYFVSPEIFTEQMQWLKDNGYHVISMDKFYNVALGQDTLPEKPVVLTFDDGNPDNYTNAFEILKQFGYTGTFFIKLNNIANQGEGMTWPKLNEMVKAGMTIGSHSINHDNLTNLSAESLDYELRESKRLLEENLNIVVNYFCYPGGAYSDREIAALQSAGYKMAVTTKHKVDQKIIDKDSLYKIPRVHIDDEIPTFTDWVQGINLY